MLWPGFKGILHDSSCIGRSRGKSGSRRVFSHWSGSGSPGDGGQTLVEEETGADEGDAECVVLSRRRRPSGGRSVARGRPRAGTGSPRERTPTAAIPLTGCLNAPRLTTSLAHRARTFPASERSEIRDQRRECGGDGCLLSCHGRAALSRPACQSARGWGLTSRRLSLNLQGFRLWSYNDDFSETRPTQTEGSHTVDVVVVLTQLERPHHSAPQTRGAPTGGGSPSYRGGQGPRRRPRLLKAECRRAAFPHRRHGRSPPSTPPPAAVPNGRADLPVPFPPTPSSVLSLLSPNVRMTDGLTD